MSLFNKFYRFIGLLLITMMIIACSNTTSQLTGESKQQAWQRHQQELSTLTHFQATGSLAYIADKTKYYGRFFIAQQANDNYQLRLTTPVGTTMFSLMVTPQLAELTDNKGNKFQDTNVEYLMAQLTGMNIPLTSLHSWFKGYSNNINQDKIDAQGRLVNTTLTQDNQNWRLMINRYNVYHVANKQVDLPTSIELTNNDNTLRLTINNWMFN